MVDEQSATSDARQSGAARNQAAARPAAPPAAARFRRLVSLLVHPLSLLPLALLIFDAAVGQLSVNPIQDLTLRTGKPALVLLLLCLACTPLNTLFGWKWAAALRKPLGLYSFLYICLHLLIFAVVDYGLDMGLIWEAVAEKRYVLVGFAAFLLLLPLALTSTRWAMRRLGRQWKRLHWLIYPAALLAVLHFLWLSKVPYQPLLFGAALAVLLALRLPPVRRWVARLRPAPARQREKAPKTERA